MRSLAKQCVARNPALPDGAESAAVARWAARLSALLIQGNGAVHRAARTPAPAEPRPWLADSPALPHCVPDGVCSYELLCGVGAPQWAAADAEVEAGP